MQDARPFMIDQAGKWKALNEQAQIEYEKSENPSVVVDFIKAYPQAIQESWVSELVSGWLLGGRQDLLKPIITLSKGENADRYNRDVEKLMIQDRVNRVKQEEGVTLTKAFQMVSKMETPVFKNLLSFSRIKNIYYEMKDFKPKVVCREEPDSFVLEVSPTRVTGAGPTVYCRWKYKCPK